MRTDVDVGPDAPTLCAGWTAFHLAAHLHLRESDPVAAAGIAVPALKPTAERRMAKLMAETDFDQLVAMVAQGPGRPPDAGACRGRASECTGVLRPSRGPPAGRFVRCPPSGAGRRDRRPALGCRDQAGHPATAGRAGRCSCSACGTGVQPTSWRWWRPAAPRSQSAASRANSCLAVRRERAAEVRFSGPVSGLAKLRARSLAV